MKLKTRFAVAPLNLPPRLPFFPTLTMWLVLDRFDAPQWLWGAVGLLVLVIWAGSIIDIIKYEPVNLSMFLRTVYAKQKSADLEKDKNETA